LGLLIAKLPGHSCLEAMNKRKRVAIEKHRKKKRKLKARAAQAPR
jgi:hypothetical protein